MNGREKEWQPQKEDDIQVMELKFPDQGKDKAQSDKVKRLMKKNGRIVFGLCVGFKGKKSQPLTPTAHFGAVVNYLKSLNYPNFEICLFPNKFDKKNVQDIENMVEPAGRVDKYMQEISVLLQDPYLQGKVYAMGGYDHNGIVVPDYRNADEAHTENWDHAAARYAAHRKANSYVDDLLAADGAGYLERNKDLCSPEEAKEIIAEEVIFCMTNMARKDRRYVGSILLSDDVKPLSSMNDVMTERVEICEQIGRMRNSLSHAQFVLRPAPTKVAKNESAIKLDSDSDNENGLESGSVGNSSGSDNDSGDEDFFFDSLTHITKACAGMEISPERAGAILASVVKELAGMRASEQLQKNNANKLSPPGRSGNSTQNMMTTFATSKRAAHSSENSPELSPSTKRHQMEKGVATQSYLQMPETLPALSKVAFIANTANKGQNATLTSENTPSSAEPKHLSANI